MQANHRDVDTGNFVQFPLLQTSNLLYSHLPTASPTEVKYLVQVHKYKYLRPTSAIDTSRAFSSG